MTQSGQGDEPSARQPREGIVLPSDGGEPLLPGMTGDGYGGRGAGRHGGGHGGYGEQDAGAQGGQGWNEPWGADQQRYGSPAPQPGEGWGTPSGPQWGAADQQGAQALPPENGRDTRSPAPYGTPYDPAQSIPPIPRQPSGGDPYGAPAPYDGSAPVPYSGERAADPYAAPPAYGAPTGQDGYGQGGPGGSGAPAGFGAPLPPLAGEGATQYIPPVAGDEGAPQYMQQGAHPEGATQFIPPIPNADGATQFIPPVTADGATQFIPPVPASEGATQLIPPVGPGALPPEAGAGPRPSGSDAEATQYIPPVTDPSYGGDRQPPAEFDNLFRGDGPAGATQQMPRVDHQAPPPGPRASRQQQAGPRNEERGRGAARTRSKVPLIAAAGVGIVVLGVGAGALLSGGGDDGGSDNQTVSATAPADQESASPGADPVKQQAVALDQLLADSGDSRASVISAVADVKTCKNLDGAASDLRDAAKQRTGLVTRLSGITVDRLPDHAALTAALTKAWQASASADNHYAAWADQTGAKRGCHKGQARTTQQTRAGNAASGTASEQKAEAARLWNAIAKTYGLTERQPTQL
ncbi:hypothetical protein ABTX35_02135 [Streptomyces sp. NPDC096080]|uniref:hypothetical protein n=1 Tax=Streptomyces sp. NPDC096080 TaxID=3156693 RepID=UPI00331B4B0E